MNRLSIALILSTQLCGTHVSMQENAHDKGSERPRQTTTVRMVKIAHPGYDHSQRVARALVQVEDVRGHLLEYYMDVDSVACADGVCEIVTLRMYWDTLGHFKRYVLPACSALTKKDHEVFSEADHKKLHSILSDTASSLQYISTDQIIAPDQAIQQVDALTSATSLSHQDSVVSGAVYTSFTLWHWANGTVPKTIHTLTEENISNEQLHVYLKEGLDAYKIFAIKQFTSRALHDPRVLEIMIKQVQEGSLFLVKPAISYFKSMATDTQADVYYHTIERLFLSGSAQKRILYIDSLAATTQSPPTGYFDRLSGTLSNLKTYYEVHRLLDLMEARNPSRAEVTRQVLRLLDQPHFFVARRAYYYLKDQSLTADQRKRVEAFRGKFQDRL